MAEEADLFGARLREHRKARGFTQRELAEMLPGKTEGKDISRYETGRHLPSTDTRAALAKALGVTLAQLYEPQTDGAGRTPDVLGELDPNDLAAIRQQLDRLETGLDEIRGIAREWLAERDAAFARQDAAREHRQETGTPDEQTGTANGT